MSLIRISTKLFSKKKTKLLNNSYIPLLPDLTEKTVLT